MGNIRKVLDLDPETDLVDHVNLGCAQVNHTPERKVVEPKQKFFAQLMSKKGSDPKEGVRWTSSANYLHSLPGQGRLEQGWRVQI